MDNTLCRFLDSEDESHIQFIDMRDTPVGVGFETCRLDQKCSEFVSLNAIVLPIPVKVHKRTRSMSKAYHRRIQKKWIKRFGYIGDKPLSGVPVLLTTSKHLNEKIMSHIVRGNHLQ